MLFRLIKRRRAIRAFVFRLPLDLQRRFGEKRYYSLAEIERATEGADYNRAFIAFAHALFCSRHDFDDYYGRLKLASTYDGLRRKVAKRLFHGATNFDAKSLLRFAERFTDDTFHESHLGEDLAP